MPYGFPQAALTLRPRRQSMEDRYTDYLPPAGMSEEVLSIKAAAGDYGSVPRSTEIKAASGMSLAPRRLIPPSPTTIDASLAPRESTAPYTLTPRYSEPGRAPLPALRTYSPAYGRFEDEAARFPSEQQYLEQNKPRGFRDRLMSDLKLGGKLLVASGFNPFDALAGLVIGGVDRNAYNRFTYRTDIEPRSVARQERYLSQAGREVGMQNTLEDNERARVLSEIQARQAEIAAQNARRETEIFPLRRRLLESQVAENEAQARKALREPAPRQFAPTYRLDRSGQYVDMNAPGGPRSTGIYGYEKPDKLTEQDYEAEVLAGKDRSTELIKRMDDLRQRFYEARGYELGDYVDEQGKAQRGYRDPALEKELRDLVETAMQFELEQETARRRMGAGAKRTLTSAEVRAYAEANGWTPDQASSYLRSTGKYIVP